MKMYCGESNVEIKIQNITHKSPYGFKKILHENIKAIPSIHTLSYFVCYKIKSTAGHIIHLKTNIVIGLPKKCW